MDMVLQMFKIDLGISHKKRDEYFENYLAAQNGELLRRGITLDLESAEDVMLLSDYAAWNYRKRTEDIPLAQNLRQRIRNRQIKNRAGGDVGGVGQNQPVNG